MADEYRIIVTGSRGWRDWAAIAWHLSAAVAEARALDREPVVVHGLCPNSPDTMADALCRRYGIAYERHQAKWNEHGPKKAGFIRNAHMVSLGADLCLEFVLPCSRPDHADMPPHDSHGAAHCAETARRGGIEVRRIEAA